MPARFILAVLCTSCQPAPMATQAQVSPSVQTIERNYRTVRPKARLVPSQERRLQDINEDLERIQGKIDRLLSDKAVK